MSDPNKPQTRPAAGTCPVMHGANTTVGASPMEW